MKRLEKPRLPMWLWVCMALSASAIGCVDSDKYREDEQNDGSIVDFGSIPVDSALPVDTGVIQDSQILADVPVTPADTGITPDAAQPDASVPDAAEPDAFVAPTECDVHFVVNVPAGTSGDVYVAGDLTGGAETPPDWEPGLAANRLTLTGTRAEGTLRLGVGPIVYKYTRGGWPTVEKQGDCAEVADRSVVVACLSNSFEIEDTVARWADACN